MTVTAVTGPSGEVVDAVLSQLGYGPKVRRERTDLDHVNTLVESGGDWPPILVTSPTGKIIDGQHRASAARQLGWTTIPAIVVPLDIDSVEARELATKANTEHGLSLTVAERKSNAEWFLKNTDFADARIADVCGLSHQTIGRLRPAHPVLRDRLRGRDGRVRPTPEVAAERREAAAREIKTQPTASDREVALRSGLSPRTVADVRRRNAAGEDPAPPRLRPVPTPEPAEPTVGDILPSVAIPWKRDERCQVSNAARDFARAMDRFTGDALKKVERTVLDGCPPGEVAHMAAIHARETAAMWSRIADQLSRPRPPKEA